MVQEGRLPDPAGAPPPTGAPAADIRRDVDAIKTDLSALRADLAAMIQGALNAGKAQAGNARERLSEVARGRLEQLGIRRQEAETMGQELLETAQDRIRDKPLQALGAAFAVGLLVGGIIVRRK